MKRTVNINLGGQVFQIDEDAYAILERYIQALKDKYLNTEGGSEIISDIEMRLAEMFYELLENRKVVSMEDVEHVIEVMGRPEDLGSAEEEEDDEGRESKGHRKNSNKNSTGKRLFRDPDDKVVAGVLSGLSAYLGITDPIWLRLIFVVMFFAGFGSTLLIYIVLAIIIPKAETASEKLQMRGEEINIDNIERTIRNGLNDLADSLGAKRDRRTGQRRISNAVDGFVNVLVLLLKAIGAILGFAFIVAGICGFIALAIVLFLPSALTEFTIFEYLPLSFNNHFHMVLAVIAAGLIIIIPLISFVLFGIRLIIGRRTTHMRTFGNALAVMFTIGVILAFYVGARQGAANKTSKSNTKVVTIAKPSNNLLNLELMKDELYNNEYYAHLGDGDIYLEDGVVFMRDRIELDVVKNTNNTYELETVYSARGANKDEAIENAELINYTTTQQGNSLKFPVAFSFPRETGIHAQYVKMTLKIPVGGTVYLSKDIREIIYDIKNVTNMHDSKMVGHTWIMLPEGLTCMDCGEPSFNNNEKVSRDPQTEIITPEPFTELTVKGYTELEFIQSDDYRIELTADASDLKDLVDQHNDEIEIDADGSFANMFDKHGLVKIKVFAPSINELNISGSSDVSMKSYNGDELDIDVDGACNCKFTVDVDVFKIDLAGATEVSLQGKANRANINMKGASELDANSFNVNDMRIEMAGACEATVNVSEQLNAELDGLSELIYIGSPEILSDVSGFSSIKPKN